MPTARLIKWNGPVIEPGLTSRQTVGEYTQVHIFKAEYDIPPAHDQVYGERQCPKYFDPCVYNGQTNNRLIVIERSARTDPKVPNCVEVEITYSNKFQNEQNGNNPGVNFEFIPDPTERPAMVVGSSYTVREAVPLALPDAPTGLGVTGTEEFRIPVVTSAGEPLILEEEYHRRRFTINKNVKELSELMVRGGDYINNDKVFFNRRISYDPGTLWLWPIEFGNLSIENGFYYYPITMTILHNPRGWVRRVRNAGYYMRSVNSKFKMGLVSGPGPNPRTGPGPRVPGTVEYFPMEPIRFSNGSKPDRPILLNKQGRPIQMVITGESPDPEGLTAAGFRNIIPDPIPPGYTVDYFLNNVRKIKHYDILSPEDFGRAFTKEELKESELRFRTFHYLDFAKELPLK